jgi:hypothetical protein
MLEETRKNVEQILGVPTSMEFDMEPGTPDMMEGDLLDPQWGFLP